MSEKNHSQSQDLDEMGGDLKQEEKHVWLDTGKLPKLSVSADEYALWCKPYINSLIVKLLGKTKATNFMIQRMERM